jgi:hypothetical protein
MVRGNAAWRSSLGSMNACRVVDIGLLDGGSLPEWHETGMAQCHAGGHFRTPVARMPWPCQKYEQSAHILVLTRAAPIEFHVRPEGQTIRKTD